MNRLCTLILFFGIWMTISLWTTQVSGKLFPGPMDVYSRFIQLASGQLLYDASIAEHLGKSLFRWFAGYSCAAFVGIGIGGLLGVSRRAYDIAMPLIYVLQLIPGLAWIPIALLLFGIGEGSTFFMIVVSALPPVVINTTSGIRNVPPLYIRTAMMMGVPPLKRFFKVMMPCAVMPVINGLRIGLANGWRVLIAAEMIAGVSQGLGYSLIQARWSLDFEASFVCIGLITIMGLVIEKGIFSVIENRAAERIGGMRQIGRAHV